MSASAAGDDSESDRPMTHPTLQDPGIRAILAQPYGRFSDREFDRRRRALTDVLRRRGCDALVICGEERVGSVRLAPCGAAEARE